MELHHSGQIEKTCSTYFWTGSNSNLLFKKLNCKLNPEYLTFLEENSNNDKYKYISLSYSGCQNAKVPINFFESSSLKPTNINDSQDFSCLSTFNPLSPTSAYQLFSNKHAIAEHLSWYKKVLNFTSSYPNDKKLTVNSFRKAGINVSTPVQNKFLKAYLIWIKDKSKEFEFPTPLLKLIHEQIKSELVTHLSISVDSSSSEINSLLLSKQDLNNNDLEELLWYPEQWHLFSPETQQRLKDYESK